MSEFALHVATAQFLDIALPDSAVYLHIPNGGGRKDAITGQHLKRMGVKAGAPDLMIFYMGSSYALEAKSSTGSLSSAQKRMRDRLLAAGVAWTTFRTVDQVERALREWGIPLKASVSA